MDIKRLVADFTERLHALVDEISVGRAREAVMHALGEKRGPLPKGLAAIIGRKPRRKGPRQLCPVPGCENAAAPVFGMVCAEHKDVSKTKIKQYREERRAAKQGATAKAGSPARSKTRGAGKTKSASVTRASASRAKAKAVRPKKPARASAKPPSAKRNSAKPAAAKPASAKPVLAKPFPVPPTSETSSAPAA